METEATTPLNADSVRLALVRKISGGAAPGVVWKGSSSFLLGRGDLDTAAPEHRWPLINALFTSWAEESDFEPLPPCRHRSYAMYQLAFERGQSSLHQLDVRSRVTFRKFKLFDAQDLEPVVIADERGFRKVRNGTEALFNLFLKCIDAHGVIDRKAVKRKQVVSMMEHDWQGVVLGSKFFRDANVDVLKLARDVMEGDWDTSEAKYALRKISSMAIRRPAVMAGLIANLPKRSRCPLLRVILSNRPIDDMESFVSRLRSTHA